MKPDYPDSLTPLSLPSEGIPEVYSSPAGFLRAASRLNDGRGPVAVDTERAGEFRYDDRAFLIQLRRQDSGTILLAPEGHRQELSDILAPALNPLPWILHSATTDLPSLAALNLHPNGLFDTELAGRLAGFDRVNLAAMVERFFGLSLAKGHGREDWSQPQLPQSWIIYAALDVEFLIPLAGALAEVLDSQGKLIWAQEEFEHIAETYSSDQLPDGQRDWTSMKGIGVLKSTQQKAIAAALWKYRESFARTKDVSVEHVLPRKALLSIALNAPATFSNFRSLPEMWRLRRRKIPLDKWWELYMKARSAPSPHIQPRQVDFPSSSAWKRMDENNWKQFHSIHTALMALAHDVDIPTDNLIAPSTVKAVVWAHRAKPLSNRHEIVMALEKRHVRPWQIELTLPIFELYLITHKSSAV